MTSLFGKVPDNSAQIAEARKMKLEAEEKAKKEQDQRRLEQDQLIDTNRTRRRSAFRRFSLLQDDSTKLGAS